jgi:hypothetical protein
VITGVVVRVIRLDGVTVRVSSDRDDIDVVIDGSRMDDLPVLPDVVVVEVLPGVLLDPGIRDVSYNGVVLEPALDLDVAERYTDD